MTRDNQGAFIVSLIGAIMETIFLLLLLPILSVPGGGLAFLIALVLLILVWVMTIKLKENSRGWAIFALVLGILVTLSSWASGAILSTGILYVAAGIMTLSNQD